MALDFAGQCGEEGGQDPPQILGIEKFAEWRRTGEVAEEDGDEAAVFAEVDGGSGRDLERRPAGRDVERWPACCYLG
jgi:hypothetical protein